MVERKEWAAEAEPLRLSSTKDWKSAWLWDRSAWAVEVASCWASSRASARWVGESLCGCLSLVTQRARSVGDLSAGKVSHGVC